MPGHCALMGATRLASVIVQQLFSGGYLPFLFSRRETRRPIRACVFYQIDRLKSGFEAMGRTVMPGNCAQMGATRLASGFFQQPHLTSGIFQQPRDALSPLVLAFFLDFITFLRHLIGWRIDEARRYAPPVV